MSLTFKRVSLNSNSLLFISLIFRRVSLNRNFLSFVSLIFRRVSLNRNSPPLVSLIMKRVQEPYDYLSSTINVWRFYLKSSLWKFTFRHYFHADEVFPKVLYKSIPLSTIKVLHKSILLSISTCRHLSMTCHTQKYFIKYYKSVPLFSKNVALGNLMSLTFPKSVF